MVELLREDGNDGLNSVSKTDTGDRVIKALNSNKNLDLTPVFDFLDDFEPKKGGIYMLRHGETGRNVKTCKGRQMNPGDVDSKLDDTGKKQALNSGENYKQNIDVIVVSSLLRTRETAIGFLKGKFKNENIDEIINFLTNFSGEEKQERVFNISGKEIKIIIDKRLREHDAGILKDMFLDDMRKLYLIVKENEKKGIVFTKENLIKLIASIESNFLTFKNINIINSSKEVVDDEKLRRFYKNNSYTFSESLDDFEKRISDCFLEFSSGEYDEKNVLFIGHSGSLRAPARIWGQIDKELVHYKTGSSPNGTIVKGLKIKLENDIDRKLFIYLNKLIKNIRENKGDLEKQINTFLDLVVKNYESKKDTNNLNNNAKEILYEALLRLYQSIHLEFPKIAKKFEKTLEKTEKIDRESEICQDCTFCYS